MKRLDASGLWTKNNIAIELNNSESYDNGEMKWNQDQEAAISQAILWEERNITNTISH